MANSIQTPPPVDISDECYPETTSPIMNEESVNLLLGPPQEEEIVTIRDLDVEIVDEIYNSSTQQEAEEETKETPPPLLLHLPQENQQRTTVILHPLQRRRKLQSQHRNDHVPQRFCPSYSHASLTGQTL